MQTRMAISGTLPGLVLIMHLFFDHANCQTVISSSQLQTCVQDGSVSSPS